MPNERTTAEATQSHREHRARKRAAGLCAYGGCQEPTEGSKFYCAEHFLYHRRKRTEWARRRQHERLLRDGGGIYVEIDAETYATLADMGMPATAAVEILRSVLEEGTA